MRARTASKRAATSPFGPAREAIRRDPKDTVSYVNRAFEYVQKGEHAQSIADYSKAIELDASRLDAYQGRAWAYLKTGKAAQGLADAERSLQIKPNDARTSTPAGTSTRRSAVATTPSPTSVARSLSSRACKEAGKVCSGWGSGLSLRLTVARSRGPLRSQAL